jgi:Kef-type K+ transport system membrane component KefB
MLGSLKVVNGVAIALIAMTAGSELEYRSMKPLFGFIRGISLYGVLGTTLLLTVTVVLARSWLPFMSDMGQLETWVVAAVLAVVMVAQSPAVVVALRDELQADGPVAQTVLGVVVLADLLVILLFALTSSLAKAVLGGGTVDTLHTARALAWELLGSLVAGAVIGYVLSLYLRKVRGGAALFLLLVAFVIAEVGQRLHFDPLLVALAAGMFIRNATQTGAELHRHIEAPATPVYILFFAVAGANLHLDVLLVVGAPAVLFVLVRAVGLLSGSRLGAYMSGAPPLVQAYAGFGLLPQAGLALALSMLFGNTFPEFGAEAGALTLGVVAINELVAPALYRYALIRSGEAGQKGQAPEQPLAPQPELLPE